MATTTNYSWTTPDDTALVKDGAAAIRSLGTAIDSTVFTNAGAAIAKSIVDAKGDLIGGTADNTVARLAVGANDTVLTADSSTATGLKWAAPAGGMTLISTQTVSTSGATVSFTSIPSTYKHLMLVVEDYFISADALLVRFNNDSGTDYSYSQVEQFASSIGGLSGSGTTSLDGNVFGYGVTSSSANQMGSGVMWLYDYNNTGTKFGTINSRFRRSQDTNDNRGNWVNFSYNDAAVISEINLIRTNGSATVNGTFKLYGVN
jgi:hypothetical protein